MRRISYNGTLSSSPPHSSHSILLANPRILAAMLGPFDLYSVLQNRDRSGGRRHNTADRLVAGAAAPVETGGGMFGPFEWPTVIVLGVALVAAVVVAIGLPRRKRPPRP